MARRQGGRTDLGGLLSRTWNLTPQKMAEAELLMLWIWPLIVTGLKKMEKDWEK